MSKRKRTTAPKHARSPKIVAKAQRAAQAIIRSPKERRPRLNGAGLPPKTPDDSQREALLVENPVTSLQEDEKHTMTDRDPKKWSNFSLATANVRAYQTKLLELPKAEMQFAFDSVQRLAAIRSPLDFPSVMAELTSKRIAMFRKFLTMAE